MTRVEALALIERASTRQSKQLGKMFLGTVCVVTLTLAIVLIYPPNPVMGLLAGLLVTPLIAVGAYLLWLNTILYRITLDEVRLVEKQ